MGTPCGHAAAVFRCPLLGLNRPKSAPRSPLQKPRPETSACRDPMSFVAMPRAVDACSTGRPDEIAAGAPRVAVLAPGGVLGQSGGLPCFISPVDAVPAS
jgi:hypothetical protein